MESATSLLHQLNNTDEHTRVEAKSTKNSVGDSVFETVSAYCNEPGLNGGYLLLGVSKVHDGRLFPCYAPIDISDTDKVQGEFVSRCRTEFNLAVRPQIEIQVVNHSRVIVAYIPEVSPNEKPIFIKSKGLPSGAFRRIGASDQACTEDDLATLFQQRRTETYDQLATNILVEDVDEESRPC